MGTCLSCRHWTAPEARTGFGNAVRLDWETFSDDYDAYEKATEEADKQYGQCREIDFRSEHDAAEPLPLAVTRDASDYVADLYTQATFGCVLWVEAEVAPDVV